MTFGEKLTELRKTKGWSQEQLGEAVGVSRQTVSKWELGFTSPEMEKLIALSGIFGISIDELVGNGEEESDSYSACETTKTAEKDYHYEYKSKATLFGLPLVHINIGFGLYKAKGVFAFGNIAAGLVSMGAVSAGLLSFGLFAAGLVALGLLAAGGIAAGAFAAGILAVGGIAAGYIAIGGMAFGAYSIGGLAMASNVAMGGYASAKIAIGSSAHGDYVFLVADNSNELINATVSQLRTAIECEFPNIPKLLKELICASVR